jgi:hypothetical protein
MADFGLPLHRKFCSRSLHTAEELTDNLNGMRNMIIQSDVFASAFALGVPGGPEKILAELDFVINGDMSGPGRQCLWLSMLPYWQAMKDFVEEKWPGSLSSEYGQEFLWRLDQSVTWFLYGNGSDRDLLDQFRDSMDLCVAKQQAADQLPEPNTVKHTRIDTSVDDIPVFQASRQASLEMQELEETATSSERPVLLAEKFRKRLEAYRNHWHLQNKVRGSTTKEEVEKAHKEFQETDFIARIYNIILRLSICQRHRIMGSTSNSDVLLENWNRAQVDLASSEELPADDEYDDDEIDL